MYRKIAWPQCGLKAVRMGWNNVLYIQKSDVLKEPQDRNIIKNIYPKI
jgi:hypothetical protein